MAILATYFCFHFCIDHNFSFPPPSKYHSWTIFGMDIHAPCSPGTDKAVLTLIRSYQNSLRLLILSPERMILDCTEVDATSKFHEIPIHHRITIITAFYERNTFQCIEPKLLPLWRRRNPSPANFLRKLGVDIVDCHRELSHLVQALGGFPSLQELTIGVSEHVIVNSLMCTTNGYPKVLLGPADIDGQLNLIVHRQRGFHKLCDLYFPNVAFTPLSGNPDGPKKSGTIPGGILESIAREMMTPMAARTLSFPQASSDQTIDNEERPCYLLSRTPLELRLQIYEWVLWIDGKINPCISPSTRVRRPPSVLDLLLTCRTVYGEAANIYYKVNEFVFYYINQFTLFTVVISTQRKDAISSVTLWVDPVISGGIRIMDIAFATLKTLPKLKRVHLCMGDLSLKISNAYLSIPIQDAILDLAKTRELDIKITSPHLNYYSWNEGKPKSTCHPTLDALVNRLQNAVDTFVAQRKKPKTE
ncbi:hypothetical protein B0J11DRAFT_169051 [Dendryphion nanum]|uniref:DUF7730 domain-containing protein n=1 Tax=Dendryphion nanum TaxID=256645 RepID=A0A9P9EFQ4_9PLEO|nr:hypothetical protein B0J11DRAFT_169051 [Dendryphion nanum]